MSNTNLAKAQIAVIQRARELAIAYLRDYESGAIKFGNHMEFDGRYLCHNVDRIALDYLPGSISHDAAKDVKEYIGLCVEELGSGSTFANWLSWYGAKRGSDFLNSRPDWRFIEMSGKIAWMDRTIERMRLSGQTVQELRAEELCGVNIAQLYGDLVRYSA